MSTGDMLKAGGGLLSAYGQLMEGDAAYKSSKEQNIALQFQAAQAEQNAGQAKAASQRDAVETNRQTDLVKSRIITLAAASGAGASDPGVINLIAGQAGFGALKAATNLYQGEEKARMLRMTAAAKRYEGASIEAAGAAKQRASRVAAVGTLISSAGSAFGG